MRFIYRVFLRCNQNISRRVACVAPSDHGCSVTVQKVREKVQNESHRIQSVAPPSSATGCTQAKLPSFIQALYGIIPFKSSWQDPSPPRRRPVFLIQIIDLCLIKHVLCKTFLYTAVSAVCERGSPLYKLFGAGWGQKGVGGFFLKIRPHSCV